jgi:fructokinase
MTAQIRGRPVLFGEVLFDHFPDGQVVLGGAPFNVAWHLHAFAAAPLLVTRIGNDPLGRRIRGAMQAWDMDLAGVQLDSAHPTGTVEVHIENNEPHYDIVEHSAWDYIDADALPPINNAALLYHGSLAIRSPVSCQTLQTLRTTLGVPTFVDINLRPPWWQQDDIRRQIEAARWLKLNEDELNTLTSAPGKLAQRADSLQQALGLDLLITTLGAAGVVAHANDGRSVQVAPEPTDNLVDTVGAGDAFASVVILGLLRNWQLDEMLHRAQDFASAIVEIRGATPDKREFYTPFLEDWKLT